MHSVHDPPEKGQAEPGPPAHVLDGEAIPFAIVTRGVTTVEQLFGEMIRLDRHLGVRFPVLVEFPRCKHTAIFAVTRLMLEATSYGERLVALWSLGCPVCKQPPLTQPAPAPDPFAEGIRAGMEAITERVRSGAPARG